MTSRIVSACAAGGLVIGAGVASARDELLEWRHPQSQAEEIVAYEALVGPSPGDPTRIEGLGLPQADGAGVFAGSISVADPDTVWVAVRAVGPTGLKGAPSDWQQRIGSGATSGGGGTTGGGGGSTGSGGTSSGSMPAGVVSPRKANALLYFDFEQDDLADWMSTGARNSMLEEEGLFSVVDLGTNRSLRTTEPDTNIHSHYVGAGYELSNITYTGRMGVATADGGVGVTAYSQYPSADVYYRLRSMSGGDVFEIAAHPGSALSCGTTSTGVTMTPGVWYEFELSVETRATDTLVTAKVWPQGSAKPSAPQSSCTDSRSTRASSGKVGVWSMGSGERFWDDLQVLPLGTTTGSSTPPDPPVLISVQPAAP